MGGWMPDIDVGDTGKAREAWQAAIGAVVVAFVALAIDACWGVHVKATLRQVGLSAVDAYETGSALAWFTEHLGLRTLAGLVSFVALNVVGSHTRHRSFTHSLPAIALMGVAVAALLEPIACAFALGQVSHVALDVLNRQGVQVLWPWRHRFSLGLCRSSGICNRVLFALGAAISVAYVAFVVALQLNLMQGA